MTFKTARKGSPRPNRSSSGQFKQKNQQNRQQTGQTRRRKSGASSKPEKKRPALSDRKIILFNKPYDTLSQFTDGEGRKTLADYIPIKDVYAAGRLDRDSKV